MTLVLTNKERNASRNASGRCAQGGHKYCKGTRFDKSTHTKKAKCECWCHEYIPEPFNPKDRPNMGHEKYVKRMLNPLYFN